MSGATAARTLRASAVTSGPIPSPAITARRMGTDPRSGVVEVGRAGLAGTDPPGDVVQQLGRHRVVDGHRHERLATAGGAADLRAGDVDACLPERGPDRADDAGTVG